MTNIEKIVTGFIVMTFVVVICCWIVVGSIIGKGLFEINKHGLKGVVEQIWDGSE